MPAAGVGPSPHAAIPRIRPADLAGRGQCPGAGGGAAVRIRRRDQRRGRGDDSGAPELADAGRNLPSPAGDDRRPDLGRQPRDQPDARLPPDRSGDRRRDDALLFSVPGRGLPDRRWLARGGADAPASRREWRVGGQFPGHGGSAGATLGRVGTGRSSIHAARTGTSVAGTPSSCHRCRHRQWHLSPRRGDQSPVLARRRPYDAGPLLPCPYDRHPARSYGFCGWISL